MNKKSIILILAIVFIGTTQSQNVLQHFNITTGVNLMNFNSKITPSNDAVPIDDAAAIKYHLLNKEMPENNTHYNNETGFYLGLCYDNIAISEKIKIQPEMRFVAIKDFNQLQIPITLKYEIFKNFNLQTAPNLGFLLNNTENINSLNFAIDFGTSYTVLPNLLFEIRYNWGQTNLSKNEANSLRINNFQIGLVYKLKKNN